MNSELRQKNPKLAEWIGLRRGSSSRAVFGPGLSYVAWLRFGGFICSPYAPASVTELANSAETLYTTIHLVALGVDDTYIMIWENGRMRWNLKTHYSTLDNILAKCEAEDVSVSETLQQYPEPSR